MRRYPWGKGGAAGFISGRPIPFPGEIAKKNSLCKGGQLALGRIIVLMAEACLAALFLPPPEDYFKQNLLEIFAARLTTNSGGLSLINRIY
jgi:hypothetical protein